VVRFKTPQRLDKDIIKLFGCIDKPSGSDFTPHRMCDMFVRNLPIPYGVVNPDYYGSKWTLFNEIDEQIAEVWRQRDNRELYWRLVQLIGSPLDQLFNFPKLNEGLFFN
jgi:hypothetical protein